MKKLTTTLLNEVMQQGSGEPDPGPPYERTGKIKAQGNGTRPRKLKTIHGEIELEKPQIREFPFNTTVFERYSGSSLFPMKNQKKTSTKGPILQPPI